jgi:hypothetical protein
MSTEERMNLTEDKTMAQRNGFTGGSFFAAMAVFLLVAAMAVSGQVRISVTQGKLDSVCGTHAVKLVFIYQNYLRYIDFSEATPQVRLINVASAYFPVISPGGRWITYQTGIEKEGPPDNAIKGKIWLRELATTGTAVQVADTAYVPRFVQHTPDDTPEIVYAKSVQCPSGICYNAGRTVKKRIVNKVPQAEQTVFGGGSYYGGLSYDNRYLVTGWPGGPNAFMLDLQNSGGPAAVHTMHVKKNGTNADTAVSVGTCNISRSASRNFTNTMFFYDFGSGAITAAGCYHPILGTWAEHGKLFISRYDAEDLKVFDMPIDRPIVPPSQIRSGDVIGKEWLYPEWSNHPYFGVATLSIDRVFDSSGNWVHRFNCESVYLINLKDSVYVKLMESTDTAITSTTSFSYPWVWVDTGAGFSEEVSWLSQTIWERSQGVIYSYGGKRPLDRRAIFSNGAKLKRIAAYTLTGAKIGSLEPVPAGSVKLENIFNTCSNGTCVVIIETRTNEKLTMRWAKTR